MVTNADLQVWLDSQARHDQVVLVSYVKNTSDRHLDYRMEMVLAEAAELASLAHIALYA